MLIVIFLISKTEKVQNFFGNITISKSKQLFFRLKDQSKTNLREFLGFTTRDCFLGGE